MLDIHAITGFNWDEGNSHKNWVKHQVSNSECKEVFFNVPLLLADDQKHSQNETRYYVLGKTNASRRLFIAFTVREDKIRIISARDVSKKEREVYAKANS